MLKFTKKTHDLFATNFYNASAHLVNSFTRDGHVQEGNSEGEISKSKSGSGDLERGVPEGKFGRRDSEEELRERSFTGFRMLAHGCNAMRLILWDASSNPNLHRHPKKTL